MVRWGGGNHFGPIDCPRKFPFIAHSVKSRMNIRSLIRGKHPTLINRLVESHLFRLGSRTSINPLKASPHYSNFSPFHSCDATLNILRFNFENFVLHILGQEILTIDIPLSPFFFRSLIYLTRSGADFPEANRPGAVVAYYFAARTIPPQVYPRHIIRERVSVSRVGFVRSTCSAKPSFRSTIQSPRVPRAIEMEAWGREGGFKRAGWPCKSRGTRLPFRIPDVALCRRIIHTRSRITQPVTTCITLMSNNGPRRPLAINFQRRFVSKRSISKPFFFLLLLLHTFRKLEMYAM